MQRLGLLPPLPYSAATESTSALGGWWSPRTSGHLGRKQHAKLSCPHDFWLGWPQELHICCHISEVTAQERSLSSLVLTGGPRSSQAAGAALVVPRRPHQEGPAAVCLISHPQHRPKGSEDPSLAAAGSLSGASNPHPVLNLTLLFLTKSISLLDVECAIANITTHYAGCGHPSTKMQRMATRSSPWNTQPFWVITARIL